MGAMATELAVVKVDNTAYTEEILSDPMNPDKHYQFDPYSKRTLLAGWCWRFKYQCYRSQAKYAKTKFDHDRVPTQ